MRLRANDVSREPLGKETRRRHNVKNYAGIIDLGLFIKVDGIIYFGAVKG